MSISELFHSLDYAPALESRAMADKWLAEHAEQFSLFINGEWVAPSQDTYFESQNPANKTTLAKIAEATQEDVDNAVAAAKAAQADWAALPGVERAKYLYALARQIQKHARLFAVLETLDNGKPIRESRDIDIPLVVRHFYHHAGWAQVAETELSDLVPVGVVAQVIPWNFPLLMLSWKIAPALAMGNTLVLKPAEQTPLTALLFAQLCQRVGLPKGVVNVITGAGETGAALVNHHEVNKVAFTGSTEVGKTIRRALAGSGKKLTLELGGKSPFIVFHDADLDAAVEGVVDAIWFNQGQVCCAGSRILVQESVADAFHEKLVARMKKLRVGEPLDKCVDVGAIIDEQQHQKITQMVADGGSELQVICCEQSDMPSSGWFYQPTLIKNISPSHELAHQEIFGPVVVSMPFRTQAEAVALANNSRYGLAASVWSENINLALDVAPKLVAGSVWINTTNQFDAACGFGGYRESGFGREGGKEGLYDYSKPAFEATLPTSSMEPARHEKHCVALQGVDRTAKLYIGGKQVRPDSGYSLDVVNAAGELIGEVPEGSRKDIRNAVEAAVSASGWTKATGHTRAQVLYFFAENLSLQADRFIQLLSQQHGFSVNDAQAEVNTTIERIFYYASWADKYEGSIHQPPQRSVTLAMPEAVGVIGIVCPNEHPLLGLISLLCPAIAMGNRVVVVPSEVSPLISLALYQVIDTSDIPAGVVNIVTGAHDVLGKVLAAHYGVDAVWHFGSVEQGTAIEVAATDNMKRTWLALGRHYPWLDSHQAQGTHFLRHATQVKNIWVPYGE